MVVLAFALSESCSQRLVCHRLQAWTTSGHPLSTQSRTSESAHAEPSSRVSYCVVTDAITADRDLFSPVTREEFAISSIVRVIMEGRTTEPFGGLLAAPRHHL